MEELKIDWSTEGFLKDASYSFHIHSVLEPYKDKFKGLENLKVELKERLHLNVDPYKDDKSIIFSNDNKSLTIRVYCSRYYNPKGKETGKEDPYSVFTSLRFILDKAVNDFNSKIDLC